jgi:hypothetical protein
MLLARISIIPSPSSFVNRQIAQKFCSLISRNYLLCILTKAPRGGDEVPSPLLPRSQVKISTNFIPAFCATFQLVIYKNLCYNTGVPNEGATPESHLKKA